jgi:acyl carrier protein
MKKKPSKADILKIISKILKMSTQKIEKIDNYTKMENWDSLAQLDIISAIDKELNGKIGKIKNIAEIKSVRKIISLLKKKSLIA